MNGSGEKHSNHLSGDKLYTILGPPGTGKTTYLAKQINNACMTHDSTGVIVTSFTRAAATEIAGRDLPIPKRNVGTLHSLAFRLVGHETPIAELHLDEWNEHAGNKERLEGGRSGTDVDDPYAEGSREPGEAGEIMNAMQVLRSTLTPVEQWPLHIQSFNDKWTDWKRSNGYIDFTDMVEIALLDCEPPPDMQILFVDESQDLTPMQSALIGKWVQSSQCQQAVICGDDDQTLYHWTGANADHLVNPQTPAENVRVLSQSYRVPRRVLSVANNWIQRVSKRFPKEYEPRDADGSVNRVEGDFRNPRTIVDSAEALADSGESVMILAAAAYQLEPLKRMLRDKGIPFGNPYRKRRGDWNPLARRENATTGPERIQTLTTPQFDRDNWQGPGGGIHGDGIGLTWAEIGALVDPLQASCFPERGTKTNIKYRANDIPDLQPSPDSAAFVMGDVWERLLRGDVDWYHSNLIASKSKGLEYPIRVFKRRQVPHDLQPFPRITIGTIHSVKGGEADNVFLFPDLPVAAWKHWVAGQTDNIIRQFYVGMTRTRENLFVARAATRMNVPLPL